MPIINVSTSIDTSHTVLCNIMYYTMTSTNHKPIIIYGIHNFIVYSVKKVCPSSSYNYANKMYLASYIVIISYIISYIIYVYIKLIYWGYDPA